ncbi:adenylyl cyclase-associated protein 1 [Thalassophryne amazonica]|uniref:adenylyl cyclase-associated protein 1 n=1 Tax=Thalassophryne amazonica TaxID=390379 RepID=UPI00147170A6|nr:adenylyl cyclase-associated protein 1 [Thalassophryne amazonica]XP_034016346.1 adenylyl cyclase-associated protein 1 [Thalassophryne amazonica]
MAELESLVQRLEAVVGRLETLPALGGSTGEAVSEYVEAFDGIISGPVTQYCSLSQKIGGDVQKHADLMKEAFSRERQILVTASTSQKPTDDVLQRLIKPIGKSITQMQEFREKNRSSEFFNHLSAVSESVPALGWVAVSPKPVPYVKEFQDASMFYTNRVLKDYKEKDKTHVDWVKAFNSIWTEMQNYIKDYHTVGLVWNKSGCVASAAPAVGCVPPPPCAPPPPGPPPPPMAVCESGASDSGPDRNALFASINQGAAITKGLKHVSDDQKTHKNPALKAQGGPTMRSGPKPFSASPKPAAPAPACTLPPVLELEGKKWKVENYEGSHDLVIRNTELKQVVYAYKCNKSTLRIKGKVNSITLDNCKKLGLVFDDVVSTIDVINCKDIKIQAMGAVPTISINKTDGCHVYLSNDSKQCEIISAKSSEMNILIPKEDGEFNELPVPEQFKTQWDGTKLVTTATEMAG